MKTKNVFISIALVLTSILSCGNEKPGASADILLDSLQATFNVSIDLDKATSAYLNEPDSTTEWLELGISNSYRLDMSANYIFLLNTFTERSELKVFDTGQNKQVLSIDDPELGDFIVDHTAKEISLLINNRSIRTIDFEGKLIREFRIPFEVSEIRKLSPQVFIGYNNYRDKGSANFYLFNNEGKEIASYLPFSKSARGLGRMVNSSLTRNQSSVFAAPFLSNKIYLLKENSVAKWLELDFGKYNSDFNAFVKRKEEAPFLVAMQSNWFYAVDKLIEGEETLACVVIKGGKAIQLTFKKDNPADWSISHSTVYEAFFNGSYVNVKPDRNSVSFNNGETVTERIKLEFFKEH